MRVDSTRHNDIPPEGNSVDYWIFGGIPRDVRMIITDPVYMDWAFVSTPGMNSKSSCVVNVKAKVVNKSSSSQNCTLESEILDKNNNVIATGSTTYTIAANATYEFNLNNSTITNPYLWDIDDPYLHTASIRIKKGTVYADDMKIKTGFRWYYFTSADGQFMLNGRALELFGLNRHETFPWVGQAVSNRMQELDADNLKYKLGLKIVRCSHYPQDPAYLSRLDEIGLMALEEAPGWQFVGDTNWQNLYKTSIEEMIVRDRNHSAIISWSVRVNESGDNNTLYSATNTLARSLDPTRPTHGVRIQTGSNSTKYEDIFTINYNYTG